MNTYTCPICGKNYTSAIAMAKCVTECAEKEEVNNRLAEADSDMTLALENLQNAIDKYNAISSDEKISFTFHKSKAKTSNSANTLKINSPKVDSNTLENFLKSNFVKDNSLNNDLDIKAHKILTEMKNTVNKTIPENSREDFLKEIRLAEKSWSTFSESDKKVRLAHWQKHYPAFKNMCDLYTILAGED